jgi:hypothetical protein
VYASAVPVAASDRSHASAVASRALVFFARSYSQISPIDETT